jgi:hypothetical protein
MTSLSGRSQHGGQIRYRIASARLEAIDREISHARRTRWSTDVGVGEGGLDPHPLRRPLRNVVEMRCDLLTDSGLRDLYLSLQEVIPRWAGRRSQERTSLGAPEPAPSGHVSDRLSHTDIFPRGEGCTASRVATTSRPHDDGRQTRVPHVGAVGLFALGARFLPWTVVWFAVRMVGRWCDRRRGSVQCCRGSPAGHISSHLLEAGPRSHSDTSQAPGRHGTSTSNSAADSTTLMRPSRSVLPQDGRDSAVACPTPRHCPPHDRRLQGDAGLSTLPTSVRARTGSPGELHRRRVGDSGGRRG